MSQIDLPDINVWLAMSAPDHAHRERAERYWRTEASSRIAFNSVTMLGLVRVCSNAPIFSGRTMTPADAWSVFSRWMDIPEIAFLCETSAIPDALNEIAASGIVSRSTWTDAYLAAFALTSGLRVVSFDADFRRFPHLDFLHLTA